MRNFIFTLLLTLLLPACSSKTLVGPCWPVADQPNNMCKKLGWFE